MHSDGLTSEMVIDGKNAMMTEDVGGAGNPA